MLYSKGPQKVQCRKGEREAIIEYWNRLGQLENAHKLVNGDKISLPTEINFPFNEIIV